MAAPESITLRNLSGKFVMNKQLSDPSDPPLSLQGISWLTRKAIGIATITLHVKEYEEDGKTNVVIEQVGTGGVKGTTEHRILDWEQREHTDHIFGKVRGQSRFTKLSEISDDFLKTGWRQESLEGEVLESNVVSVDNGWTAEQIWGFEDINGERRYTRHAVVKKGDQRVNTRLVYDYQA